MSQTQPITITIPPEAWPDFQQLVFRAVNLWPDASPEIKAFADRVTEGHVLQDYHKLTATPAQPTKEITMSMKQDRTEHTTQAINLTKVAEDASLGETPMFYHTFASDVAAFNKMYQLNSFDAESMTSEQILQRLGEVQRMWQKEVNELQDIIDKVTGANNVLYQTPLDFLTDLADLCGDLQVYAMSEMLRWSIPGNEVLRIIMASNESKMGPDGKPIIVDGKLEKGPNYWKPEPKIRALLEMQQKWKNAES